MPFVKLEPQTESKDLQNETSTPTLKYKKQCNTAMGTEEQRHQVTDEKIVHNPIFRLYYYTRRH